MLFIRLAFIIMTLYHPCSCYFFSPVGKVGQNSLVNCGGNLAQAKDTFKKKYFFICINQLFTPIRCKKDFTYNLLTYRFFDKTKNEWEHRGHFEKIAGKYDMVYVDYSTEDKVKRPQYHMIRSAL